MATLNIKNLPDALYAELKARAERQHRSVAQEVTHILTEVLTEPEPLSLFVTNDRQLPTLPDLRVVQLDEVR